MNTMHTAMILHHEDSLSHAKLHDVEDKQLQTILPGAMGVLPIDGAGHLLPTNGMLVHENMQALFPTITASRDMEPAHGPTLKVLPVNDNPGLLINATLLDIEAEQKFCQQH